MDKILNDPIGEVPKIRGTSGRVPITRILVFWGLHWGPLALGTYYTYMNCRTYGIALHSGSRRNLFINLWRILRNM